MKFRTDFVTNSSSSCFCASLCLSFDNGVTLYADDQKLRGDGEGFENCSHATKSSCKGTLDGNLLCGLVADRKNIEALMLRLCYVFDKEYLERIKGASELTGADLSMSVCARGEYCSDADISRFVSSGHKELSEDAAALIKKIEDAWESTEYRNVEMTMNQDGKIDVDINEYESYDGYEYDDDDFDDLDYDDEDYGDEDADDDECEE